MASFLERLKRRQMQPQATAQLVRAEPQAPKVPRSPDSHIPPATPDYRYQIHQKCLYERSLPGDAYITAHVQRLQSGFYDSPNVHEDTVNAVRFVAVNFVFHPSRALSNRFKAAVIKISLCEDVETTAGRASNHKAYRHSPKPRFLRHAPHLIYGSISPESLQWSFSLAGSLGVSQIPVFASLNPSGGLQASYKLYEMLRIQGSSRTLQSVYGPQSDLEDGQIVWSLEENVLQRSGLPREFTFVLLLHKPPHKDVLLDIDVEPVISSWFGSYPKWWLQMPSYSPFHKHYIDLDKDIGEKFEPVSDERGFNFATLGQKFDMLVALPGTTYTTKETTPAAHDNIDPNPDPPAPMKPVSVGRPQQTRRTTRTAPDSDTLNVRVYFENSAMYPSLPRSPGASSSATHRRSLRHVRSRDGLKEYGLTQELPAAAATMAPTTPTRNRQSYPGRPLTG